jgi:NDP-sugar pyrophosphorylase family protein
MKAVILAAGKGTRMKGLTDALPKPMLKIQGKPILEHIITGLKSASVSEFFIVTGHRAEVVENYFGDGSNWNVRIAYGRQIVQDGTGKAPELAREFVGTSPFIFTYGDVLVLSDDKKRVKSDEYRRMISRFNESDSAGVVTVTGSEDVTKGGLFFFDDQFCLKHLVEKPSPAQLDDLRKQGWLKAGGTAWYNAGIYIFRPLLFDFTTRLKKTPRGEYELTDAISAMVAAGHRLAGLQIEGRWVDVRDPEVLASLQS